MDNDRSREILKAAASGAGGVILPEERDEMLDAGLLADSEAGLIITPLGRRVLAQS